MRNTSDSIEEYIKELLAEVGIAELRRTEIAETFQVVPSQINYVIKTRFTESRGYVVESKRGGKGYIRIGKIEFSDQHHLIKQLTRTLNEQLSERTFADCIQLLFDEQVMTEREGNLFLAIATDAVLGEHAAVIRRNILQKIFQQLDRKGGQ